jgi:hypothetical protein
MTQPQSKEKYILTHPKDESNEDILYRFMLTLNRRLAEKVGSETIESRLLKAIGTLDGVDGMQQGGMYTIEVVIARTFDPAEVITELKRRLDDDVLSEIITPNKKIIV